MKVTVKDLDKALTWLKGNSPDLIVDVSYDETSHRFLQIKTQDKYGVSVTIKIYNESKMMPRIIKEDQLP